MIDIHTHILPSVDDGSQSMEIALKCLKTLQNSGVTDVFLTPHYIPGEYDNTKSLIKEKCRELKEAADKESITLKQHCGIELYLTGSKKEESDFAEFRMGESDYVLVETAMQGFPVNLLEHLYLMVRKGLKPILAHPERYIDIIQDLSLAEDLIYRNVYLQANAGSFLGLYGRTASRAAWEMFQKGYFHFIASDYHCQEQEYPLKQFRDMISENYPEYPVDYLLLDNPAKIIANEKIDYINSEILTSFPENNSGGFLQKLLRLFNNE